MHTYTGCFNGNFPAKSELVYCITGY